MHIVKNFFEKLTFQVFAGKRVPSWAASKNKKPDEGASNYESKMATHLAAVKRHTEAVEKHKKITFDSASQSLVDRRVKQLVGPAKWIKKTMVPCTWSYLSTLIFHNMIVYYNIFYIFQDLFHHTQIMSGHNILCKHM